MFGLVETRVGGGTTKWHWCSYTGWGYRGSLRYYCLGRRQLSMRRLPSNEPLCVSWWQQNDFDVQNTWWVGGGWGGGWVQQNDGFDVQNTGWQIWWHLNSTRKDEDETTRCEKKDLAKIIKSNQTEKDMLCVFS